MTVSLRGLANTIAITLLLTVASQIFYMYVVNNPANADQADLLRRIVWMSELALFSLFTITAMVYAMRGSHPLAAAALALSGIVNVMQVAMGLSMFGPAQQAADAQVFQTVLQAAFFFYFQAKALLGLAAIGFGLGALRDGNVVAKLFGGLAILAGLAAAVTNLLGMAQGMADWTFSAGAAGTAAAALLGLTLLALPMRPSTSD